MEAIAALIVIYIVMWNFSLNKFDGFQIRMKIFKKFQNIIESIRKNYEIFPGIQGIMEF